MSALLALLRRDLVISWRDGGAIGTALGFYLVVVAMLPLGLGPDPKLHTRIAPGVLWVALLLSALLSSGRLFEADAEDGSLPILAMGPVPLALVAAVKALAHAISTGLPLILATPALGLLLSIEIGTVPRLVASMLLGLPAVSFIAAIGAALTLRARKGGVLLALLVLPLYVPTLIFGIGAATGEEGSGAQAMLLLTAVSLAAMVLAPIAVATAIRAQLS